MTQPRFVVRGYDLALNHSGFVQLVGTERDGYAMDWWRYVTQLKRDVQKPHGTTIVIAKRVDHHQHKLDRLLWWDDYFNHIHSRAVTHIGIEDYAFMAESNSTYQIGELGGLARRHVLRAGISLRLHDPTSVKMYSAHNGGAGPSMVAEAVQERWPETQIWRNLPQLVQEDLTAAYVVARMVLDEARLRFGLVRLETFDPKEIQVFNRTTKANPVSILGREWLTCS